MAVSIEQTSFIPPSSNSGGSLDLWSACVHGVCARCSRGTQLPAASSRSACRSADPISANEHSPIEIKIVAISPNGAILVNIGFLETNFAFLGKKNRGFTLSPVTYPDALTGNWTPCPYADTADVRCKLRILARRNVRRSVTA